jgi:hypothetical protein
MQTPQQRLEQQRARLAVSRTYAHRIVDQDPDHQDQLDKNRVPGALDNEKLFDDADAPDEEEE